MRVEKLKKTKKQKARSKISSINKFAANFKNNIFLFNKDGVSIYRCYIYKYKISNDVAEYSINSKNSGFRRYLENKYRIEILIRQKAAIQQNL